MFNRAFENIESDANGRSVTTISAPQTPWRRATAEYKTTNDIKKFEVRHSMVRGDGPMAAPEFICFVDEIAKAAFVVKHPELYPAHYVTSCQDMMTSYSSEEAKLSSSHKPA